MRKSLIIVITLGISLFILQEESFAKQEDSFDRWLQGFKQEAHDKHGISYSLLDRALHGIKPLPRVIELDRKQPEGKLSYREYMKKTLPAARIKKGRELYAKHYDLLKKIEKKYGVQAKYIVALWGKETDYGRYTGGFSIIESLATLAYEGRRREFFTEELVNALKILQQKHISLEQMKGSWAGAMGQSQFMPSAFLRFAVDENGDGRRDIWNTQVDVFASIANYLHKEGWNPSQTWGRQVQIPSGLAPELVDITIEKSLQEWQALGVRSADGSSLPKVSGLKASLIQPNDKNAPYFLVYPNYKILLKWNRSRYFANAVGTLADSIE